MKPRFVALTLLTFSLFAALVGASARADQLTVGRFNSYFVSTLTLFRLSPSLETFATESGEVSVDLARRLIKLSLDSQRGRFEVELPVVSREIDECGVVIYRAQAAQEVEGAEVTPSIEIRDRSRSLCATGNVGFRRAPVVQVYLVYSDDSLSSFEGTAFVPRK